MFDTVPQRSAQQPSGFLTPTLVSAPAVTAVCSIFAPHAGQRVAAQRVQVT